MKSYSWFKLLLDQEQVTNFNDDPGLSLSEGRGVLSKPSKKTPVMICADFLAQVAKHAYAFLAKRMHEQTLLEIPLEFWFTVPAVWSDKAKTHTLLAAQMATQMAKLSFHPDTRICLIQEPEAAAIATLSALGVGGSEYQVKVSIRTDLVFITHLT